MGSLPALQIELLGSRTVGPGAAASTRSAWTGTAACSPHPVGCEGKVCSACGPPQPAETSFSCFSLRASCNELDLFSRIRSVWHSCSVNAVLSVIGAHPSGL